MAKKKQMFLKNHSLCSYYYFTGKKRGRARHRPVSHTCPPPLPPVSWLQYQPEVREDGPMVIITSAFCDFKSYMFIYSHPNVYRLKDYILVESAQRHFIALISPEEMRETDSDG